MRLDFEEYDSATGISQSVTSPVDEHVKGSVIRDFVEVVMGGEGDSIPRDVIEVECEDEGTSMLLQMERIYAAMTKRTRMTLSRNRFLAKKVLSINASTADIDLCYQKWQLKVNEATSRDIDSQTDVIELNEFSELIISLVQLDDGNVHKCDDEKLDNTSLLKVSLVKACSLIDQMN